MYFNVLCSGSKGNCCIVGSGDTKIVIDCGSTVTYLKKSFEALQITIEQCDGILITHEHSDHIKQIRMFKDIPVYAPFAISSIYNERIIQPLTTFKIGCLTILPLPLSHDTGVCFGYIITDGKETLVQVTDTGYLSASNIKLITGADYYIFESNHDPEMLMATRRPDYLKKRILSDIGHMSNEYAADVLCQCIRSNTREIALAHISQEANTYELAYYTTMNELLHRRLFRKDLKLTALKQFEIYRGGNQ